MRLGLVDLGTNSVRLDIYEIFDSTTISRLYREKLMIRLGDGVFSTGKLDDGAIARTVAAFENFKQTADAFKVTKVIAIGTSALREAKDSSRLVREIKSRTGIAIEIISGTEEARLIAEGVLKNEQELPETFALVDIGGGSTEISLCKDRKLLEGLSFDLGVARLKQLFITDIAPETGRATKRQLKNLRRYVSHALHHHEELRKNWGKVNTIVGSSGTIKALAKLIRKNGVKSSASFDRESLRKLVKMMSALSLEELAKLPGMEDRRLDLIVPGGILLDEIMEFIGAKRIIVTEFSLRDGLLLSEIDIACAKKTKEKSLTTDELRETAVRLGVSEEKFDETANLLQALFLSLNSLHRLEKRWGQYILAARIFSIIAQNVNAADTGYYAGHLALHVDLPYVQPAERKIIAELCYSSNSNVAKKKKPANSLIDTVDGLAKGLAILQLLGVLQEERGLESELPQVSITRKNICISVAREQALHLTTLKLEKRREVIERIFGRTVTLSTA